MVLTFGIPVGAASVGGNVFDEMQFLDIFDDKIRYEDGFVESGSQDNIVTNIRANLILQKFYLKA